MIFSFRKIQLGAFAIIASIAQIQLIAESDMFGLGVRLHSDEVFRKQFLNGFTPLAEREPGLTEVEGVLLKKTADMFKVNTAYAQRMLETVLKEEESTSATFNYILGNLYFGNEDYILAEKEYELAIEKYPDFQRAWTNLGVLRLRGDDVSGALEAFSKSIALGDVSPSSYGKLAYCHYALGHYMSAEAAYTMAIMSDPGNPQWLEGKVEVYMDSERFPEAVRMIDELIRLYPEKEIYWLAQSNAFLSLGEYAKAARNIEVVRRLGKAGTDSLYQLGRIYARLKLGNASVARFQEAISANPQVKVGSLIDAALSLQQDGDIESASELLGLINENMDQLTLANESRFLRLSATIAESEERWSDSIESWNLLIEKDPLDGNSIIHLATLQRDHGSRDWAYLLVDRIGSGNKYRFEALLFKSQLLAGDQRFSQALPVMEEALRIRSSESLQNLYVRVAQAARVAER